MTDSILSSGIFLFVFTSKHIIIKKCSFLFQLQEKRQSWDWKSLVLLPTSYSIPLARPCWMLHMSAALVLWAGKWETEVSSEFRTVLIHLVLWAEKWAVSSELSWSTWCCEQRSEQWVQNCLDPPGAVSREVSREVSSEFRTVLIHLVLWAVSSELSWSTWCCEQRSEQWVQNCLDPPGAVSREVSSEFRTVLIHLQIMSLHASFDGLIKEMSCCPCLIWGWCSGTVRSA